MTTPNRQDGLSLTASGKSAEWVVTPINQAPAAEARGAQRCATCPCETDDPWRGKCSHCFGAPDHPSDCPKLRLAGRASRPSEPGGPELSEDAFEVQQEGPTDEEMAEVWGLTMADVKLYDPQQAPRRRGPFMRLWRLLFGGGGRLG